MRYSFHQQYTENEWNENLIIIIDNLIIEKKKLRGKRRRIYKKLFPYYYPASRQILDNYVGENDPVALTLFTLKYIKDQIDKELIK